MTSVIESKKKHWKLESHNCEICNNKTFKVTSVSESFKNIESRDCVICNSKTFKWPVYLRVQETLKAWKPWLCNMQQNILNAQCIKEYRNIES